MKDNDQRLKEKIQNKEIGVKSEGLGYFGELPYIPNNSTVFLKIELMNTYTHNESNRVEIQYYTLGGVHNLYAYYWAPAEWVKDKNMFLESFAWNWQNIDKRLLDYDFIVDDDIVTIFTGGEK